MPVLTVVVEQCLAPVPGGTGRYTQEITAALAAKPPPGWSVATVVAWHRDIFPAAIAGAAGPRRLVVGRRGLSVLWEHGLPPWLRGDSVHASTPMSPPRRRQLVVTVHDAVPWTHPETLTPRGVRWHRTMVSRAMHCADAVVVPSTTVADDLAGIFPSEAGRLHVVPHGVTALVAPTDAAERRARMGLPERYVLSVATLEPRKGLDVLIEAMALPAVEGTHLVVAGPGGWGGVDLGSVAARAGLAPDRLHAPGRLDDEDLAAVLNGAAVLAAPSLSEGFGLPALEAMAAGVPVVCSDAPALVELVGAAGLVTPRGDPSALADTLRQVLTEPALAADLVDSGRRRASDFSWAVAASLLWNLHAN